MITKGAAAFSLLQGPEHCVTMGKPEEDWILNGIDDLHNTCLFLDFMVHTIYVQPNAVQIDLTWHKKVNHSSC